MGLNAMFLAARGASAAPGRKIDQRNPEVRALLSSKCCRDFGQDHFERRPHRAGQQAAAAGRAVGQRKHDVDVTAGHSGANSSPFAAPQATAALVACVLACLSDLASSESVLTS